MVKTIIMYYGEECPHCHRMMPSAKKIAKKLGFKLELKETWHNAKNGREIEKNKKAIIKSCGVIGVPAFFNPETKDAICGEMPEVSFKNWLEHQNKINIKKNKKDGKK